MARPSTRSIWKSILTNFINSLKPRRINGDLIGTDHFGNKYFEIPTNPSLGQRKLRRWFEPPQKDDFMQEMPAEWESWLRGRRLEPPSEVEVQKNFQLMQIKKKNAVISGGLMNRMEKGMESFPNRPEYEMAPGTETKK